MIYDMTQVEVEMLISTHADKDTFVGFFFINVLMLIYFFLPYLSS